MKKIILGLICFVYSSCAVTTTMVGDVTTFTLNGEILQKWEQVVLQDVVSSGFSGNYVNNNAFKTFGINFYDKKSGKYIIIGNAVPCIIEYTTKSSYNYSPEGNTQVVGAQNNIEQSKKEEYKNELINQWKTLSAKEKTLKSLLKNTDKKSDEYQNLKNQYKGIVTQMDYVSNKLINLFNYDILARGF